MRVRLNNKINLPISVNKINICFSQMSMELQSIKTMFNRKTKMLIFKMYNLIQIECQLINQEMRKRAKIQAIKIICKLIEVLGKVY